MKTFARVVAVSVVAFGCSSAPPSDTTPEPPGPPEVRPAVIERHAAQFADELPERPPGSNEEQVAASYVLGFLQQAGYPGRLDGVPFADLVRSTNVIGTPPEGGAPEYVVAVPYSTPPDEALDAHPIGVFLEVARALNVRDGAHLVQFVALGAEFAERVSGPLGSTAMASLLGEESFEPRVIYLSPVVSGEGFYARGPLAGDFEAGVAPAANEPPPDPVAQRAAEVFESEGFEVTLVGGDPLEVAVTLLEFLSTASG